MTRAISADNVYLIDTEMFGFKLYHSAYLVVGDEVALVDTGAPPSWQVVREAIKGHGFDPADIDHVLITHAEHPDHSGCVGALLAENERAVAHVSALGAEYLTHPEIEAETRRRNLSPAMAARFGKMQPVPLDRLRMVGEGDVVDLGRGVRLKVALTPGHQPSGLVAYEEKHGSLFINDLCGAQFADAGASFIFTPYRSDVRAAMASLRRLSAVPAKRLCMGHFGISDRPAEVIEDALVKMHELLDIGAACTHEGRPEEIEARVRAAVIPEIEKLGQVRGPELSAYLMDELVPSLGRAFATYYRQLV